MRFYLLLVAVMVALLLGLFALAEALEIPVLTDPRPWLGYGGWVGASTGVGLLIADVLIPVPSSLIMIAHGAVFGVVTGTFLSLLGSLGAGWLGFYVGRRGGPLLARWVPAKERERVGGMLESWGGLAIVASRPIPVLAETVAILAGTSAVSWAEMTTATLLGSLPASFLFALSGAAAVRLLDDLGLVILVVLAVASPAWLLMRAEKRRTETRRRSQASAALAISRRRVGTSVRPVRRNDT